MDDYFQKVNILAEKMTFHFVELPLMTKFIKTCLFLKLYF